MRSILLELIATKATLSCTKIKKKVKKSQIVGIVNISDSGSKISESRLRE